MQIKIENLIKIYKGGSYALNNLNLDIPNGMFGLLGPNGAGKSTLLKMFLPKYLTAKYLILLFILMFLFSLFANISISLSASFFAFTSPYSLRFQSFFQWSSSLPRLLDLERCTF